MRKLHLFLIVAFSAFLFVSCENTLTDDKEKLELDSVVKEQAAFGWQVTRMVASSEDIESLTQNSIVDEEETVPELPGISPLLKKAESFAKELHTKLPDAVALMKIAGGDSLLFYEEKYIGQQGSRTAFYYNFETGKARVYETIFQFPSWRNLVYDSTEIKADLNLTLDISNDDRIEEISNLQLFKDSYFVNKIETSIEVTDYSGTEITGAKAAKDAYYKPDRWLTHLKQRAELNPDQSGTLREDFTYKDGTSSYESITFLSNNTGTFSRMWRDGTEVSGEFNQVEDDLQGSYSETTDFPDGRFIDKIFKSATVSLTMPDSVFNAAFEEIVYFSSGKIDSTMIGIESDEDNGIRTTNLEIHKPNGAFGTIIVIESETESTLNGNWTTWNDYYIIVSAEYYFDGSSHVHYEVYEPPYNPGDNPVIVADYYISPDQSGTGTLSHNGESYQLNFDESGKATITQGGQSTDINLF